MKAVLIVDDDQKIRGIYNRLLSSEGFKVMEASNAADANELLKRKKIDLILLDIKMPEIDGGALYNIIKMFHGDVRVIVASVYPVDEQKRIVEGAHGYFDKSQGFETLLAEIRDVMTTCTN